MFGRQELPGIAASCGWMEGANDRMRTKECFFPIAAESARQTLSELKIPLIYYEHIGGK